jgi:hypothetical protein
LYEASHALHQRPHLMLRSNDLNHEKAVESGLEDCLLPNLIHARSILTCMLNPRFLDCFVTCESLEWAIWKSRGASEGAENKA